MNNKCNFVCVILFETSCNIAIRRVTRPNSKVIVKRETRCKCSEWMNTTNKWYKEQQKRGGKEANSTNLII